MSDRIIPDSTSNDGYDTLKRFWTIQDEGDYSKLSDLFTEDAEQCDALSAEGLAIARRLDDDPTLARGLHLRSTALLRTGELAERGALAREALVIADRLDDPHLRFLALMNVAGVSVELADIDGGRAALDPARQIADDLREPAASGFYLVWEAGLAMLGGDFATGERLAFEAFALADQAGDRDADLVLACPDLDLPVALAGRDGLDHTAKPLEGIPHPAQDFPADDARNEQADSRRDDGPADLLHERRLVEILGCRGLDPPQQKKRWHDRRADAEDAAQPQFCLDLQPCEHAQGRQGFGRVFGNGSVVGLHGRG